MKRTFKILTLLVLGLWTGGNAMAEDHYVNGAGTVGWLSGNEYNLSPVAMVNVKDDVWVWSGKIKSGERFRITGLNWGGFWATSDSDVLGTEEKNLKNTQDGGDFSFVVNEEGIYRVTADFTNLKIKAEKMAEPSKDGDYYLIGSVDNYYWYAGTVTFGEQTFKARLTADLDFGTAGFFPLSCDKYKFKGEFDGAGHTITNAVIKGSNNNVAFIRYGADGANIHDLVIEGSFTGSAKIGGVIGFARDGGEVTLTNVINKANVQATGSTDANAAGLVGCAVDGTKITATNCANMGEVRGQDGNCSAFAGWTQSGTTFTNCWNSGAIYNMENNCNLYRNTGSVSATNCWDASGNDAYTQGTKIAPATIASGELCYSLNGDQNTINWYQNLTGTVDAHPVPFASHSQVYANGQLKCDGTSAGGELTYSNESTSTVPPHTDVDGWCSVCGSLIQNHLTTDSEGFYSLGTAKELNWFAAMVAEVNQFAKAKLTADIDYTDYKQGFIGISQATPFRGTFDGQEHSITIDIVNISNGRTGLFSYINAATIKNLVVEGSATSAGNNCVGGLGGRSDGSGTLIENVVVKTAVSYTGSNGDATCGGFFANMENSVTLKNCAFYGSINTGTAEGNGGLVGWAGGGSSLKFENCLVAPTAYTKNGNSADFARNNPTTIHCYNEAGDDARLASGEMTYVMNEAIGEIVWFQNLTGTVDAYPVPFSSHAQVYANGYQYCDGTVKSGAYENEDKGTVRDPHNFGEWGFCTNKNGSNVTCDQIQPEFATLTDGFYQIGNAKELNWFAVWTDREDASVKAKLTADIDMTEVANFPGIGSGEKNYTGEFDGQRHIISNMKMDWDREGVGLVNRAASGAKVKNVTIAANCSFKGSKAVAGIVGGAYGTGDIYIENCGNEGTVESTGQNAGGIVGVCFNNGGMIAHLTNVYNVGVITGATANESGSLSGWMTNAVLVNCYSIAGYPTSENTHGFQQGNQFARGNNIQLTNCYDFGTGDWGQNNGTWGQAFADGRKINEVNETEMGRVFASLFDAEGGNVWRMEYDSWAHPVLYDPAVFVLSENIPNRFSAKNNVNLTLKRTTYADGDWETICLPFDLTDTQVTTAFGAGTKIAKLNGSEGETLKFITVTAIEAGKPYLFIPTNAITTVDFANVDLVPATTPVTEAGLTFTGILEPTKIAQGDFFIAANNMLTPSDGNGTLKAFRTYFKNEGGNAKVFVVDDVATGIVRADGTVETLENVYTLSGVRVNKPTRGLYIINGKKTVIK